MTIDWLRRMRDAGVPADQAEAIASMPEERYLTREYLDARLAEIELRVNSRVDGVGWRLAGLLGLATAILLFALPRLITVTPPVTPGG